MKIHNKILQPILYIIVGGLTTIINYIVFFLLDKAKISIVVSQFVSFIVSVVFAYITNKIFVFQSSEWRKNNIIKEFSSFVFARLFSFLGETLFLLIAVDVFKIYTLLSKLIATVFVMIFNYFISKKYVFANKNKKEG